MVRLTGIEEFMRSMAPVSAPDMPLDGAPTDAALKRRLDALKARRRDLAQASAEEQNFMVPTAPQPRAVTPVDRPAKPAEPAPPRAPRAVVSGAGGHAARRNLSGVPQQVISLMQGDSPKTREIRRMLKDHAAKLMQILTKTPADGTGLLPGTPFTMTGIARLSHLLHQRAGQKGGPGTKIAGAALALLREPDASKASAHGLSITRIQALWQRAEQIVYKGGSFPGSIGAGSARMQPAPRR